MFESFRKENINNRREKMKSFNTSFEKKRDEAFEAANKVVDYLGEWSRKADTPTELREVLATAHLYASDTNNIDSFRAKIMVVLGQTAGRIEEMMRAKQLQGDSNAVKEFRMLSREAESDLISALGLNNAIFSPKTESAALVFMYGRNTPEIKEALTQYINKKGYYADEAKQILERLNSQKSPEETTKELFKKVKEITG